jgi:hypothetical protein
MSLLNNLPPLSECTIDYFDSNGVVVFQVNALNGLCGNYEKINSNLLDNKLLPYIEQLRGSIIQLEQEIKNLKNK